MKLEDVEKIEREYLTPQEVGAVIGSHPATVRLMARKGKLGFRHIEAGSRVKFPKDAFLAYMKGRTE